MAEESIETTIDLNKIDEDKARQRSNSFMRRQEQEPRVLATDGGDDDLNLEIIDDTPEGDRGRRPKDPTRKSAIPEDEEIGQYTKGVQDRLRQMKREYHDERRAKEQWAREHGVALDLAQRVYAENQKLRKLVEDGHKTMLDSNKSASENELAALQASLQAAHEAGDSAKIADLQGKIAKAAARSVNIEQTQPLKFDEQPKQLVAPQRQAQPEVKLSNRMQDWMGDNPWFNGNTGAEKKMTSYAFGVHDDLIQQGIPPESPAYFKAINEEMKEKFPEYYGEATDAGKNGTQTQRRTVGGASRLNGSDGGSSRAQGNKKVSLTLSEVAVAKRLGVSNEQYAREKLRLEQSNG